MTTPPAKRPAGTMPRAAIRAARIVAIAFALAVSSRAEVRTLRVGSLLVELETLDATSLRRAYQPVFAKVANKADHTVDVGIRIVADVRNGRVFEIVDRFDCGPREVVEREIVIPVPWSRRISVVVESEGSRRSEPMVPGIAKPDDAPAVLAFGEAGRAPLLAAFESDFAWPANRSLAALPRRLASLSAVDLVVVDLSHGAPEPDRHEILLAFGKIGGRVAFTGASVEAIADRLPCFAPYLGRGAGDATLERPCGFGRIFVFAPDSMAPGTIEPALGRLLAPLARGTTLSSPRDRAPARSGNPIPRFAPEPVPGIPDPATPPRNRAEDLLVTFALTLAIGPLSFLIARVLRKPMLVFVLTPATAFVAIGAMTFFGLRLRGFSAPATALTVSYLDQRTARATAIEMRAMRPFAHDRVTSNGRFGFVVPEYETGALHSPPTSAARTSGEKIAYAMDVSDDLEFRGAFAPAGRIVRQLAVLDAPSSARIEIEFVPGTAGGRWVATNRLGAPIRALAVRIGDGECLRIDPASSPLPHGESRDLATCPRDDVLARALVGPSSASRRGHAADPAPPPPAPARDALEILLARLELLDRDPESGEFLAVTTVPPFRTTGGIALDYRDGAHLVLGAFAPPVPGASR